MGQAAKVALLIDHAAVERMAEALAALRERGGGLFLIGVGGSAANCSHAVNDFRKLAGIECYSPCDNVAELTARTNEEGWSKVFESSLVTSQACCSDAILVLSVGGGDSGRNVSSNIVPAVAEAKKRARRVFGILGRDGGHTARFADEAIIISSVDADLVTPLAESFRAIVWHCLVCHPKLLQRPNRWESISTLADVIS